MSANQRGDQVVETAVDQPKSWALRVLQKQKSVAGLSLAQMREPYGKVEDRARSHLADLA